MLVKQNTLKFWNLLFFCFLYFLHGKAGISFDDLSLIQIEDKKVEFLEKGSFFSNKDKPIWNKGDGTSIFLKKKIGQSFIYKDNIKIAKIKKKISKDRIILNLTYNLNENKRVNLYQIKITIEIDTPKNRPITIKIKEDGEKGLKFVNRYPKYSDRIDGHYLDFSGRVTKASSKNVIVVPYPEEEHRDESHIVFMFGASDQGFVLDFDPALIDESLVFAIAYAVDHVSDEDDD